MEKMSLKELIITIIVTILAIIVIALTIVQIFFYPSDSDYGYYGDCIRGFI